MAGKPIATVGSMHVCPMCSGTVPHVGGAIIGPGIPGATINGQAISVVGDMCSCAGGPPDVIVQGSPGVTLNGIPIVTVGSMTAHGGQVTSGIPGVTITTTTPSPVTIIPIDEIPFPEISIAQKIVSSVAGVVTGADLSQDLRDAQTNQDAIREESEEHGYLLDYNFSL